MSIHRLKPRDHWEAELDKCSKSGLRYLVELLAFIDFVPREQMLLYAKEANDFGRREDWRQRFDRDQRNPELFELRRLQKRAKALKSKLKKKESA